MFLFSKERNTRELINDEIERMIGITGTDEFDRNAIRELLKVFSVKSASFS